MIKVLENTRAWVVGIGHAPAVTGGDGRRDDAPAVDRADQRHGVRNPTRDETLAEARAAVNLAVALLSFFTGRPSVPGTVRALTCEPHTPFAQADRVSCEGGRVWRQSSGRNRRRLRVREEV